MSMHLPLPCCISTTHRSKFAWGRGGNGEYVGAAEEGKEVRGVKWGASSGSGGTERGEDGRRGGSVREKEGDVRMESWHGLRWARGHALTTVFMLLMRGECGCPDVTLYHPHRM